MAATLTARVTNMNGQIVAEKRGGQHRVLNSDPLGNVVDVRDSAGMQLASYNFWPYGEVRTSTGSISNPWMFCGVWGYYFGESTYYVRARTLRTDLTRWTAVDPMLGYPYAYSRGNPLNFVDPNGLTDIHVRFSAFIPKRLNTSLGAWLPFGLLRYFLFPYRGYTHFLGDNRGFGEPGPSRLTTSVVIDSCSIGTNLLARVWCDRSMIGQERNGSIVEQAAGTTIPNSDQMTSGVKKPGYYLSTIRVIASAGFIFTEPGSPNIQQRLVLTMRVVAKGAVEIQACVHHTIFPSFELITFAQSRWGQRRILYSHEAEGSGPNPVNLQRTTGWHCTSTIYTGLQTDDCCTDVTKCNQCARGICR